MPTANQIDAIAKTMTAAHAGPGVVDAGYTYFGQFVSHEIVAATHPPAGTTRVATPVLDLDSLYGTEQEMPSHLNDDGEFPIRSNFEGGPDDLPRTAGRALIPEPRNDDNVIIAQLHLFLQRFHNFTLQQGFATDALEARRLVTQVFQLLTVEDYLRQVLAPVVFDSYFRFDRRWLDFDPAKIPREFSHAAFRFGHSMVRASYDGFPLKDASLDRLFQPNKNLDEALVLDWTKFFGWPTAERRDPDNDAQVAARIDPFITSAMAKIPGEGSTHIDIVAMNLRAAADIVPPLGTTYVQQIVARPNGPAIQTALSLNEVPDMQYFAGEELAAAHVTIHDLPLWPYILLEAMHASLGRHLGVLGSMICAEVIRNAIVAAPHSIYQEGWHSIDDVLARLGKLGERLQAERARRARADFCTRSFCMRHLISLVTNEP
jgi:hypothetical protein